MEKKVGMCFSFFLRGKTKRHSGQARWTEAAIAVTSGSSASAASAGRPAPSSTSTGISGMRSQTHSECRPQQRRQKLIGSQNFYDSPRRGPKISSAKSTAQTAHSGHPNQTKENSCIPYIQSQWPPDRERPWPTAPSTPFWCSTLGERHAPDKHHHRDPTGLRLTHTSCC